MKKIEGMLALALLLAGCAQPAVQNVNENVVTVGRSNSVAPLADIVDHIELIPLETGLPFLLGVDPMLTLSDDSFVLTDTRTGRVLAFNRDGSFRCRVGVKGRGPGEYPMILSSQVAANGSVTVFSYPDKVLFYGADGEFVREEHREDIGTQSCLVPEGMLVYFGYGSGRPGRAALMGDDGSRTDFLPTSAKIINMTPNTPVFTFYRDTVYFTDTYNPVVYAYKDGKIREEVTFDFGKTAIGEDFYHYSDPYEATNSIMQSPIGFSLVRRYLKDDRYQFLEEFCQKGEEVTFHYGFESDGTWKWFSFGKGVDNPFSGMMQDLYGNSLYFLMNSEVLAGKDHGMGGDLAQLRALVSNPEVLDRVTPDDNPVVARLYLK